MDSLLNQNTTLTALASLNAAWILLRVVFKSAYTQSMVMISFRFRLCFTAFRHCHLLTHFNHVSISACNKTFDLTIVIENSAEIGESNFEKIKAFAKKFVNAFEVTDEGTHVAIISYGTRPLVHVLFDSFSGPALTKRLITDTIDEIDFHSDRRVSPNQALNEVLNTVYADGNGARNGTNKVKPPHFYISSTLQIITTSRPSCLKAT